jgi:hypothetical protein
MGTKFLQATLLSGVAVVSEFENLGGSGQGYATQVFACVKPFNAWRKVGSVHPQSGETVAIRTRVMYSGAQIASIAQVKPKAGFEETHEFQPENFEPVAEMRHGRHGMYVAPSEATPNGAVAGAEYPVHRQDSDFRRYVILRAATATTPELRHWIDAEVAGGEGGAGAGGVPLDDLDARRRGMRDRQGRGRGPADADEDIDD